MNLIKGVKRNFTIPNLLSLLRIAIIIPMSKFILTENYIMAGVMLVVSAVSDMLDGIIARKFDQVTQLGKMLDPVADKLTLIAVVLCVNRIYPYVYPFVIVMFVKEIVMLEGGAVLIRKRIKPPPAMWFGKAATAVFYVSMIMLVLLKAVWNINISWLATSLFALSAAFMLFALMNYAVIFFEITKVNGNKKEN